MEERKTAEHGNIVSRRLRRVLVDQGVLGYEVVVRELSSFWQALQSEWNKA